MTEVSVTLWYPSLFNIRHFLKQLGTLISVIFFKNYINMPYLNLLLYLKLKIKIKISIYYNIWTFDIRHFVRHPLFFRFFWVTDTSVIYGISFLFDFDDVFFLLGIIILLLIMYQINIKFCYYYFFNIFLYFFN